MAEYENWIGKLTLMKDLAFNEVPFKLPDPTSRPVLRSITLARTELKCIGTKLEPVSN